MTAFERGRTLGIGGTNYREVENTPEGLRGFEVRETPKTPEAFFRATGEQVLRTLEQEGEFLIVGVPGEVSRDGMNIGPLPNVSGLKGVFNLYNSLDQYADPAARRAIEDDEIFVRAVNDGTLAAHAAATRVGKGKYDNVGVVIVGTGVGGGQVVRGEDATFRDSGAKLEIGHYPLDSMRPWEYPENTISGPALEKQYGDPSKLRHGHIAWNRVGHGVGTLAMQMGINHGTELIVPTGSVGIKAYSKYQGHMERTIGLYERSSSIQQRISIPEIRPVAAEDADTFELYGGPGVAADYRTRAA